MTDLCTRCGMNEPAVNDEWCNDCVVEIEILLSELESVRNFRQFGRNGTYTAEDIQRRVAEYEDEYGLSSDALMEMEEKPEDLSHFDRHVWLSFYRELMENHA